MSNEMTVIEKPEVLARRSSDVAGLCKEIVVKTAIEIQGRKYVKVEGWQSIATAHGCVAGCRDVERIDGGFRAIGELKRMSDGAILATAEGFVGSDEPTWFGGDNGRGKMLPKRPDYAIRAMCQTRAISRVCRSAFAHVVVLMDAGLSTTPAEEVPDGGFVDAPQPIKTPPTQPQAPKQPVPEGGDDLNFESATPLAVNPPEPSDNDGESECIGQIEAISTKTGSNAKGPWTKTSLKVNGEWYQSFSETIAKGAKTAKDTNHSVRIIYREETRGNFTNRNIEFLTVLE